MKILNTIILLVISLNLFTQSTNWNEYKLKEHWKTTGIDEFEGIYESTQNKNVPQDLWGVIKSGEGYDMIFLESNFRKQNGWKIGDIIFSVKPTATTNLYRGIFFDILKKEENVYVLFEQGMLTIKYIDRQSANSFIKLYPTVNDNIVQSGNQSKFASGTGFGISSSGIIVTNFHVIDGAKTIKVRGVNSNFNITFTAKVLVSDKNNDLALIQIDDYGFTSLGTIPYTIKTVIAGVGENIFVLGYPLRATMGDEIKLTNGIVSSRTGFQGDITTYQISAPVQPGNSGGPLFDSQGNLIGIINAKHSGAENASYAVKSSYLINLIDLLPAPLKIQTVNSLTGKTLTQQVALVKKFVYIIEVN